MQDNTQAIIAAVLGLVVIGAVLAVAFTGRWALGLLEVAPVAIAFVMVGWHTWSARRVAVPAGEAEGR